MGRARTSIFASKLDAWARAHRHRPHIPLPV